MLLLLKCMFEWTRCINIWYTVSSASTSIKEFFFVKKLFFPLKYFRDRKLRDSLVKINLHLTFGLLSLLFILIFTIITLPSQKVFKFKNLLRLEWVNFLVYIYKEGFLLCWFKRIRIFLQIYKECSLRNMWWKYWVEIRKVIGITNYSIWEGHAAFWGARS